MYRRPDPIDALLFVAVAWTAGCQQPDDRPARLASPAWTCEQGGIIRGPRDRKQIALIFTGDRFGEGAPAILDTLGRRQVKASFFVTGRFLDKTEHESDLRRIVAEGHYLGPHSNDHLLYCSWEDRAGTLVSERVFRADLERNLAGLVRFGCRRDRMRFFVPPYEWYNEQVAAWARRMGLVLINFTPGTYSHADWAPEGHRSFRSAKHIRDSVLDYESAHADGLNGFLLLFHLGAGPDRTDKVHPHLAPLVEELMCRGYRFVRVDELLASALRGGS